MPRALREGLGQPVSRPQVLAQAAMMLVSHDRSGEAVEFLKHALDQAPGNPDLLLAHASVLALAGRDEDAQKALDSLEARWP